MKRFALAYQFLAPTIHTSLKVRAHAHGMDAAPF